MRIVKRHRGWMAGTLVVTVAAGLASRKYPWLLPAALGKYPGDVLWAQMVYWGIGFLAPSAPIARVAVGALAISYVDELSQLYQGAWINHLRATTLGHLVLGSAFAWGDLVAYTVGVALGVTIEVFVFKVVQGHARAGSARQEDYPPGSHTR